MARLLQYDHYKVLGINRSASIEVIKRAYREKVKYCHPDVNDSPKAAEVFNAVQEAYDTLMDKASREAYDKRMEFYRPTTKPLRRRAERNYRRPSDHGPQKATVSFAALHLVGIIFALAIGVNALTGILVRDWPLYTFVFSLPAMFVLPDAVEGFHRAIKSWGWT